MGRERGDFWRSPRSGFQSIVILPFGHWFKVCSVNNEAKNSVPTEGPKFGTYSNLQGYISNPKIPIIIKLRVNAECRAHWSMQGAIFLSAEIHSEEVKE